MVQWGKCGRRGVTLPVAGWKCLGWQDFHSREYFPRLQHIDNQPGISLTAKGGRFFKHFWEKPNKHFYRLWGRSIQNLVPTLGSELAQLGGQVAKIVFENELAVVDEILQTMKSGMAFLTSHSSVAIQVRFRSGGNGTTHSRDVH